MLLALLGNLRGGLIVALAIPLSMLFAANVMLATGNLGQPDEPGCDRFRPDRRLQRDHDRELRAPAGARRGNAAEARHRPRRGHRGPQADDVRRADHRDRLPADPGAPGDRRQAVPPHGPDRDLRPGRLAAPVADLDAGARRDGPELPAPGEGSLADPLDQAPLPAGARRLRPPSGGRGGPGPGTRRPPACRSP